MKNLGTHETLLFPLSEKVRKLTVLPVQNLLDIMTISQ